MTEVGGTANVFEFKADGTGRVTMYTKNGEVAGTLSITHGKKSNTFTIKGADDTDQTYRIQDDGNELVMPKFLGAEYDGYIYNINPPKPISLVGTKWAGQTTLGEMTFEFKDESTCHQYAEKMNNKDNPSVASYTLKGNQVTYILGKDKFVFFIEGNQFVIGSNVYLKQASAVPAVAEIPAKFRRNVVSYNLLGTEHADKISHVEIEWSKEGKYHTLKLIIYRKEDKTGTFTFSGGDGSFGTDMTWNVDSAGWSNWKSEGDLFWLRDKTSNNLFVPAYLGVNETLYDKSPSPNRLIFVQPGHEGEGQIVIELDGSFFSK
jgi:hypothetical protein